MSTQSSTSPGTSTISTGVRPASRNTSTRAPAGASASAQRCMSCTARSMWPCDSQSGSKMGDLFGMRTYSTSCGRIESDQAVSRKPLALEISI
jgi:hypothetical protein